MQIASLVERQKKHFRDFVKQSIIKYKKIGPENTTTENYWLSQSSISLSISTLSSSPLNPSLPAAASSCVEAEEKKEEKKEEEKKEEKEEEDEEEEQVEREEIDDELATLLKDLDEDTRTYIEELPAYAEMMEANVYVKLLQRSAADGLFGYFDPLLPESAQRFMTESVPRIPVTPASSLQHPVINSNQCFFSIFDFT